MTKKQTSNNSTNTVTLFDCLRNILTEKSDVLFSEHTSDIKYFNKVFSRFMIIRYLSMHPNSDVRKIVLENQLSLERFIDNVSLYKFLINIIPKQRIGFISYIK